MNGDKAGIAADRRTSNRRLASPAGLVTACAAIFCGFSVTKLALASSGERSRVVERSGPASSECEPNWVATFDAGQLNGPVYAMTVFDDSSGPALYVGGAFTHAGDLEVNRIARWDGPFGGWSPVHGGPQWLRGSRARRS